ncbi:unnamed protein product [Symbiodinium microadriaticum]|nr:unnamed protein product [Symbiodinium microadriaticum]
MRKHEEHPFEDSHKLEQLCKKFDHSLFAFGSSSKKRPARLILGRLFDGHLLDMQEFGVEDYKSMSTFRGSGATDAMTGVKPLVVFQGAGFENDEHLKRAKSLLLDYFGGGRPDKVLLPGLESAIVFTVLDPPAGGRGKVFLPCRLDEAYDYEYVKGIGGIMLLMMFRHSAVALAYYDEDGDRLQRRKERYLDEMTKQVGDVLSRATNQAQKLCGMVSAQLDEKVGEHVRRMQRILAQCEKSSSPEAQAVYSKLVELMALFLEETLRQQKHTSMVQLLTVHSRRGGRMDLPRTETAHDHDDPEMALLLSGVQLVQVRCQGTHMAFWKPIKQGDCIRASTLSPARCKNQKSPFRKPLASKGAQRCCTCCYERKSRKSNSEVTRTTSRLLSDSTGLDRNFSVPSYDDLVTELREPTMDEYKNNPEAKKGKPSKNVPKQVTGHRTAVYVHLLPAGNVGRDSPLYRSLLVGIFFSVLLFIFHFHLAGEELHELSDFKHQIDTLNANDLADEDSDISMLQVVERSLSTQKRIVAEFYNNAWGDHLDDITMFKNLIRELQDALDNEQPRKAPRFKPSSLPVLQFLWQYLRNSSASTSPEQKHCDEPHAEVYSISFENCGLMKYACQPSNKAKVLFRRYRLLMQKSGGRLPRIEMKELGPSFQLTLDRTREPDKDRWKQAIKVPKAAKPKKVKNVKTTEMGKRIGKFHLGKQDFNQIHTIHHGASKKRKLTQALKQGAANAPKGDTPADAKAA